MNLVYFFTYLFFYYSVVGNVYIADLLNYRIRKVTVSTDIITTIAGTGADNFSGDRGAATSATLSQPYGVAVDSSGAFDSIPFLWFMSSYLLFPSVVGNVYIADYFNRRVRKVKVSTGIITTIAGTGTAIYSGDGGDATSAGLVGPYGVAFDSSGNVYIADKDDCRIRKVTVSTGIISTIAGTGYFMGSGGDNGPATSAILYYPTDVAVDAAGRIDSFSLFHLFDVSFRCRQRVHR